MLYCIQSAAYKNMLYCIQSAAYKDMLYCIQSAAYKDMLYCIQSAAYKDMLYFIQSAAYKDMLYCIQSATSDFIYATFWDLNCWPELHIAVKRDNNENPSLSRLTALSQVHLFQHLTGHLSELPFIFFVV